MPSGIMALQYQCPECNKSFEKEHSLDQHMRATGHEFVDEEYSDEEYCAEIVDVTIVNLRIGMMIPQ